MPRWFVLTTLTAVMVTVGGQSLTAETPDPTEDTPTYNGSVGQLLLENCAACHRPNQIGPMSLLTYKDARRWARTIKSKVVGREMPPWFADPRFGHQPHTQFTGLELPGPRGLGSHQAVSLRKQLDDGGRG